MSYHSGCELAREGAFARVERVEEAARDGVGEGASVVQNLAEDGESGLSAAGRSSGGPGARFGGVHPGFDRRTAPSPRRCPGTRLRPFRNSRASIGRFPAR